MQSLGNFTISISSYVHSYDATENKTHFAGVDRATLVRPSQLPNREYMIQANLIVLKIPISRKVKKGQDHFSAGYDSLFRGQREGSKENLI